MDRFQQQVLKHEKDVEVIFAQEQEERIIRKAEMDAEKAQNMLDHSDEIFSRPKRTWFQDWNAKKESAKRAKAAAEGHLDDVDNSINNDRKRQKKEKAPRPRKEAPIIVRFHFYPYFACTAVLVVGVFSRNHCRTSG